MQEPSSIPSSSGAGVLSRLPGPAVTAPVEAIPKARGWIESPFYDLSLFTLSPIAGLLLIALERGMRLGPHVGVLAVYFVGIPHYLSTFTFYLGDQNRTHSADLRRTADNVFPHKSSSEFSPMPNNRDDARLLLLTKP
jgi:hypothetical protein